MAPEIDTIERIRDLLAKIELGVVSAYDGFKNIRWHADVYLVWAEATGAVPRPPAEKPEPAAAGSKSQTAAAASAA